VAEQSAKAVIFRFMFFSALSTRHEPTGLYIFSLLLYANGNGSLKPSRLRQVSQDLFKGKFSSIPENLVAV
jgi:hypothetical protein